MAPRDFLRSIVRDRRLEGVISWPAILSFSLIALTSASCSKKSTNPEPTSYSIVVVDVGLSRSVFFVDPDSMAVVDSIPRVGLVYQGGVAPDGRSLFLATMFEGGDPQGFYKWDLLSKTRLGFLPISVDFVFTNGGRTVVAATIDSLYFIDVARFEVEDVRPSPIWTIRDCSGPNIIVGPTASTPFATSSRVTIYDLDTGQADTLTIDERYDALRCSLHPDNRRVFVVGLHGEHGRLYVVDFESRETREICQLRSWLTRVVFSASGDTTYVISSDDLDNPLLVGPGRGELLCFSTAGNDCALLAHIDTGAPLLSAVLSPSGDRLYVGEALNFHGVGGDILVYDTRNLTSPPDTIPMPRKQSGPSDILIVRR